MKTPVLLTIEGRQYYDGQTPDVIELTTEGTMQLKDGGWEISYVESDLTGLNGVTTTFRVEPERVVLTREGKLHSQMVFRLGQTHESLYQMEFGALMISVCARQVMFDLTPEGGFIDLVYDIDIEQSTGGTIDAVMEMAPKIGVEIAVVACVLTEGTRWTEYKGIPVVSLDHIPLPGKE